MDIFYLIQLVFSLSMKYNSQYKQDLVIDHLLKKKKQGTFLECGAHNGIRNSNSLFFERDRNWSGICVEPIPSVFEELVKNRKCYCVNGALSNKAEELEFKWLHGYGEQLSGVVKFRDEKHDQRTNKEVQKHGGSEELIKVAGYTVSNILDRYNMRELDYFSLDIEGGELEILQSIDFKKYQILYLTVENNYECIEMSKYMISNGYKLIFNYKGDDFYVLSNYFKYLQFFSNGTIFILWVRHLIRKWRLLVKINRYLRESFSIKLFFIVLTFL